jgi:hypothetical protein
MSRLGIVQTDGRDWTEELAFPATGPTARAAVNDRPLETRAHQFLGMHAFGDVFQQIYMSFSSIDGRVINCAMGFDDLTGPLRWTMQLVEDRVQAM